MQQLQHSEVLETSCSTVPHQLHQHNHHRSLILAELAPKRGGLMLIEEAVQSFCKVEIPLNMQVCIHSMICKLVRGS